MIQPMLAYKVGKKEINYSSNTVFLQPKLDGVRCVITKDGCYTRTGNQWLNVAHIEAALAPFFKEFPDKVLDGELYNHGLKNDFEKIMFMILSLLHHMQIVMLYCVSGSGIMALITMLVSRLLIMLW